MRDRRRPEAESEATAERRAALIGYSTPVGCAGEAGVDIEKISESMAKIQRWLLYNAIRSLVFLPVCFILQRENEREAERRDLQFL